MNIEAYRDEIKLKLTGGVLDLEITDSAIDATINSALREIQRYIDTVAIKTLPFESCIDVREYKINSIVSVNRTEGFTAGDSAQGGMVDPMIASQWQLMSGAGSMARFNSYVLDYAAWNTMLQIRNTSSTDLSYYYDKPTEKLYINIGTSRPQNITISYVPRFDSVDEITSDFWIDMIMNLSVALTKITLGRIRSRFTQSNALWAQDGETLLNEGNQELADLREKLKAATQLTYPYD